MTSANLKIPRELRWGLLLPLLILNLWVLFIAIDFVQPLFSILLVSSLLAFILDIPLRYLERRNISRGLSIALVMLLGVAGLALLGFTALPRLTHDVQIIARAMPEWLNSFDNRLSALDSWAVSQQLNINWSDLAEQLSSHVGEQLENVGGSLLSVLSGSLNSALDLFFALVFTIFLLLGGKQVCNGILSWLSPWWQNEVRTTFRKTFTSFIAGRLLLGVLLSFALAIIFMILRVHFAWLAGFVLGLTSILPFFGTVSTVVIGGIYLVQDIGMGIRVLLVAFILGQLNDAVVYPKVVGKAVDLNPVWLLISVLVGFKMAGILGLLFAVPVASCIKKVYNKRQAERQPAVPAPSPEKTLARSPQQA